MAELKSGVIGCAICIFALMGSIFGASLMTADTVDRTITTYDYIADVTGTFDTTNAPEYIDYNPAANYVGYSTKTVNYTNSLTPNAYRYIVSYPQDITIDKTVTETTISPDYSLNFSPSQVKTKVIINYTGGNELGTSTTSNGMTYNGAVINKTAASPLGPSYMTDNPIITRLTNILSSFTGYNSSGIIDLTVTQSGNQPLLMTPTSAYTHRTLSAGDENLWEIYHVNISASPTRIVYNHITGDVTVYNGSTVLFTETSPNNVDVYYKYEYNMGGTAANAVINTTIANNGTAEPSVTVTNSSSYPNYPSEEFLLGINNTVSIGSLPTTSTETMGAFSYNIQVSQNSSNKGLTRLSNIISSLNIPSNTHATIHVVNNNDPTIFVYAFDEDLAPNTKWVQTSSENYPYIIDYATDGTTTIYYHPTGSAQSRVAYTGSADNVYVAYRYYITLNNNQSLSNVSTTFNCHYTAAETMTITQGSSISGIPDGTFDSSDAGTTALMNWNGTYDMGVGGTYAGISYDLVASRFHETGNPYSDIIPDIWTLEDYLQQWGLNTYTLIDMDISGNTDYPVLFYYGNWTRNDNIVGDQTQYVYSATLNESNSMPDYIHIIGNTATAYRNGTEIYTGQISSIYIINKYSVNTGSGFDEVDTYANITGYATKDVDAVSITVNNNSSYPSDAYTFRTDYFNIPGVTDYVYLYPLIEYNGTAYNNMGINYDEDTLSKTVNICLTDGGTNSRTTYITKLNNIFSTLDLSIYDSLDLNISYGTHPIIFTKGDWEYTSNSGGVSGIPPYRNIFYYYYKEINDSNFPNRVTYNKATDMATFYKNDNVLWTSPASKVQVIYKYWIFNDNDEWIEDALQAVTDQSATFSGIAKLTPSYQYANPEMGVTLKDFGSTTWKNNYQNDVINILWTEQNADETNDLNIMVDTSSVRITRNATGEVTVFVTKQNGDTDLKNIGNWHKGQLTINVSAGTLTVTPIAGLGSINFTDAPIEANATSYIWTDWYSGDKITQLTINTSGKSLRFGVNGTSVFLNTYGVVMFDPSLDIETFFPELTEWRLNFFSFALVGDSVTINDVTYPINKANNSITVTDIEGNSITGIMNNVYLTKEITNGYDTAHYYLNFANSNKSADLGEVTTNTVSFEGMWYFTTGLYELGEGTAKEWTWLPQINLDFSMIALIYIAMVGVALIIGKGVLHADISGLDWVILICSSIIALIIAGGVI